MTADELIEKIRAEVERADSVGVELWLPRDEWLWQREEGGTFIEFLDHALRQTL